MLIILAFNLFFVTSISAQMDSNSASFNILLNGKKQSLAEVLNQFIQIESISGHEKNAGEFIKNICVENGLHITQMGSEDGNYNFAASMQKLKDGLPNIIFLNHIDVIPYGDVNEWIELPNSGLITETEIWGRGAFDNKGTAIMQLASIINFKKQYGQNILPYNITLLSVSCEETQCKGGAQYVVDNYLKLLNPAVVICEGPTALKGVLKTRPDIDIFGISVAHKRPLWLEIQCEIESSSHGSITPTKYANKELVQAVYKLTKKKQSAIFNNMNIAMLIKLGKMEKGFYGFVLRHPKIFKPIIVPSLRKQPELFALFSNTITLTHLQSNSDLINAIPNKATALLDCRLLPNQSNEKFLKQLNKIFAKHSIKTNILFKLPEIEASPTKNIFYKNLSASIQAKYPKDYVTDIYVPNTNDAGYFRLKGIPVYSSIPIKMDMKYMYAIHGVNERIPKKILVEGAQIYLDFISRCMTSITIE